MYYATLRQKQSERRALKQLIEFGNDTSKFIPNIIVKDSSQESLDELRTCYNALILLDVRELDSDEIVLLEDLLRDEKNVNFEIMYPIEYILNNETDESRRYVRIDASVINSFFVKWLNENHKNLPLSVMLDFEFIDNGTTNLSKFQPVIESLKNHDIIISSGAIPQSVPVPSEENYTLKRFEKDLFSAAKQYVPENSRAFFGDYTSVSPILSTGGRAIVQIKYTLDDNYLFVRNGQRTGNYDFVAVCKEISKLNEFNVSSCWGDSYIKQVVDENQNKGNPSVWTSIGISKHIAVCLKEN
ncbi:beta family protein [Sutcliffiella sp. NC1]|uniref:beta family protein n=1 Tax=Sutcliffiella sp. NC1 TaxID=3004096 RepID=UPI0022DE7BF5|nr:hypothetical protein [Sutcliffiella sp. NC1]WBL16464.1 hypothetical protein O1A01_07485 [Sutcliffiella sp. NC1]